MKYSIKNSFPNLRLVFFELARRFPYLTGKSKGNDCSVDALNIKIASVA